MALGVACGLAGAAVTTLGCHGRPNLSWASGRTFAWHVGRTSMLGGLGVFLAAMVICAGPSSREEGEDAPTFTALGMGLGAFACYCGAVGLAAARFSNHLGTPREAVAGTIASGVLGFIGLCLSK